MNTEDEIKKYLVDLEDDETRVRNIARHKLASIGSEAVPDLITQLKTDRERCRW